MSPRGCLLAFSICLVILLKIFSCWDAAVRGISATYGHHDHAEAKGDALERLAAEIQRIIDPPPDTVIQLREAGG